MYCEMKRCKLRVGLVRNDNQQTPRKPNLDTSEPQVCSDLSASWFCCNTCDICGLFCLVCTSSEGRLPWHVHSTHGQMGVLRRRHSWLSFPCLNLTARLTSRLHFFNHLFSSLWSNRAGSLGASPPAASWLCGGTQLCHLLQ